MWSRNNRQDHRRPTAWSHALAACSLALSAGSAMSQEELAVLDGPAPGAYFGEDVFVVRDLDGDGVPEYCVGSSAYDGLGGQNTGAVWVVSGRDTSVLWQVEGAQPADLLGRAVADIGDQNGDGTPDLAVGVPRDDTTGTNAGALWILSGKDGALLDARYGSLAQQQFGRNVVGLGDVDGDGTEDLVVSTGNSEVTLFSGATLAPLDSWSGNPLAYLGLALAGLGDVDGDGVRDILIGSGGGFAVVRSGATGAFVRSHQGLPVDFYGTVLAAAGDLDADGRDDYLISAPLASDQQAGTPAIGRAYAYSGRDGALLYEFEGSYNQNLGSALVGLDDVDRDGHADFAITSYPDSGGLSNAGLVSVYSGASGALLWSLEGSSSDEQLGKSLASGADFDGDGVGDLLIGAVGTDVAGTDSGRVQLLSAAPVCSSGCTPYCDCSYTSACGNAGAPGSGCANSVGSGARLAPRGSPSVSRDTLWLHALGLPPARPAILLYSSVSSAPAPFGDGSRCLVAPTTFGVRLSGPVGSATWGPGLLAQTGLSQGQTLYFQALYRDSGGPCGLGFNVTGGVQVDAAP